MKDGETVFEEYAYPYSADIPHTMFSLTKSVVSTAAGFAIEEGLFSLDTKLIDVFGEYEHCESDEWENLTVRSVLTMQSNKEFTFLQDMRGNYTEMFMKAPFRKKGGFLCKQHGLRNDRWTDGPHHPGGRSHRNLSHRT